MVPIRGSSLVAVASEGIRFPRINMSISNTSNLNPFHQSSLPFGSSKLAVGETSAVQAFADRRKQASDDPNRVERRQFGDGHRGLSAAGRELALAIDRYKLRHHRRYLTCDELLRVMMQLGYTKS
jgi:hypothetical protein